MLTTALSQTNPILSSTPLVPSGIRVKSSLPIAFWEVLYAQWALPTTWRSPLCKYIWTHQCGPKGAGLSANSWINSQLLIWYVLLFATRCLQWALGQNNQPNDLARIVKKKTKITFHKPELCWSKTCITKMQSIIFLIWMNIRGWFSHNNCLITGMSGKCVFLCTSWTKIRSCHFSRSSGKTAVWWHHWHNSKDPPRKSQKKRGGGMKWRRKWRLLVAKATDDE